MARFGQIKITKQIPRAWFVKDVGTADWIFSVLVDPLMQARVVVVMDFFIVDRVWQGRIALVRPP